MLDIRDLHVDKLNKITHCGSSVPRARSGVDNQSQNVIAIAYNSFEKALISVLPNRVSVLCPVGLRARPPRGGGAQKPRLACHLL